ncbi:putative mitochondrial carrier [Venturia nashicola]|nr:putative mitochondrial carrier [Venturia nashicola]
MPPLRTPVSASRPVKTERTHEENQERAYIAASRRSDRSLEARIESARRASEIHKKRTGRGLRVTEQDVINEEMYEEEDDDLPSQYRRLQAHIASTADIFNGRLNAYLLSAVGTRSMILDQNMGQIGQPQNIPFFPYTPPQSANPQVTSPTTAQKGQGYRPAPYPNQQARMDSQQQRSASLTSIQDVKKEGQSLDEQNSAPSTPQQSTTPMGAATTQGMNPGTLLSPQFNLGYGFGSGMSTFDPMMQFNNNNTMSPLTAALPNEAQQFFGTNFFDPSNAYTPYFMNAPSGLMMPQQGVNYNYNPNLTSPKTVQTSQSMTGMNQTLSQMPTTMDSGIEQAFSPQTASAGDISSSYNNPTYAFPNYFSDGKSGDGTTTLGTPTNEYDSFLNYNQDE